MSTPDDRSRLVYSTETGRLCPQCQKPRGDCRCQREPAPLGDGKVRVSREKQKRGGKTVTVVRGLPLDAAALAAWGKSLRSACGAGGTVKDGAIEVQGDHVERVMDLLVKGGWSPKRSGG